MAAKKQEEFRRGSERRSPLLPGPGAGILTGGEAGVLRVGIGVRGWGPFHKTRSPHPVIVTAVPKHFL